MKKILLTGADGMLGNYVLRELLGRGYQVVALTEPGLNDNLLPAFAGLSIFHGDILKPQELTQAFQGCDAVIHAAAITSTWPPRSAIQRKVNYEGTLNVISAALAAGVEKMVHVGSASTFGFGTKASPGDENSPYASAKFGWDYWDSKKDAHYAVLDAVKTKGLPATILAPTFMFGAYDSKPGSGAMIVFVHNHKVLLYTPGGRNFVYTGDVATGIVNALEGGRTGEAYILGNQNLSYGEAFPLMARTIGKPKPSLLMPGFVAKSYGALATIMARMTGRPPTVSYQMMKAGCVGTYYSARKAIRELDLPQTPIETAIRESYEWLCQYGVLAPSVPVAKAAEIEMVNV